MIDPKKLSLVYALVDPVTLAVRYIGVTVNLSSRVSRHLRNSDCPGVRAWVAALSVPPRVIVLEHGIATADRHEHEGRWLARGRHLGWPLLNEHGFDAAEDRYRKLHGKPSVFESIFGDRGPREPAIPRAWREAWAKYRLPGDRW